MKYSPSPFIHGDPAREAGQALPPASPLGNGAHEGEDSIQHGTGSPSPSSDLSRSPLAGASCRPPARLACEGPLRASRAGPRTGQTAANNSSPWPARCPHRILCRCHSSLRKPPGPATSGLVQTPGQSLSRQTPHPAPSSPPRPGWVTRPSWRPRHRPPLHTQAPRRAPSLQTRTLHPPPRTLPQPGPGGGCLARPLVEGRVSAPLGKRPGPGVLPHAEPCPPPPSQGRAGVSARGAWGDLRASRQESEAPAGPQPSHRFCLLSEESSHLAARLQRVRGPPDAAQPLALPGSWPGAGQTSPALELSPDSTHPRCSSVGPGLRGPSTEGSGKWDVVWGPHLGGVPHS